MHVERTEGLSEINGIAVELRISLLDLVHFGKVGAESVATEDFQRRLIVTCSIYGINAS